MVLTRSHAAFTLLAGLVSLAEARAEEAVEAAAARARHGGAGSVVARGDDAFGYPVAVLSAAQRRAFMVGNALFRTNWIASPASAEGMAGLGPLFNARSCSSCHLRDGRGAPPLAGDDGKDGDDGSNGFLVRLAASTHYGGQLQEHAVAGMRGEGRVVIREELLRGSYADGTTFELAAPRYAIVDAAYGAIEPPEALSPRVAPQMIGLGLLEIVPEATLLARADPDDRDGDGISGRPRWIEDGDGGDGKLLGRFGWKAGQPTVRAQVAAAFANDMGITSSAVPRDDATAAQRTQFGEAAGGSEPELSDLQLDRVAFYSAALAVPERREVDDPEVARGEALFAATGCASCHVVEWTTGDGGAIVGLRGERVRPYTDLLLHDLGPRLADGLGEGDAAPSEWRTPPLWGIGLIEEVNGHRRFLHDGRARGLEEAILWHGGEAEASATAFRALDASARAALLRFLQSL